ncbi:MAG: N(6)-L-threonylcarbamoyladenine synthase Kae1 [Candidatus Pacearchaeota archaeon]|nr:N(6)-L-threonylcarbamoyladenine synthase Kae1 [Candidatus Pacearchaeota archaeon]
MVVILGIESTAHTFGVGIVQDGKVVANVKDTYTTESGGIIPVDAAKHHREKGKEIYEKALSDSGIDETEIDAIAFSQGPGLPPCLREGLKFAKELASKLKKPLVPVNHCIAHLEIGRITGSNDPVMLYTSGANTQVIAYSSGKYRVFGETLDLGVGNFIDTFARYLGLGFPGGPKIQKLAEQSKNYVELPYTVKGMDIALSGILTNLKQKIESRKYSAEELSYSMQETVFSMLVEVAERALAYTDKKEILLAGGVACNPRLKEMCKKMCDERLKKTEMFVPDNSLLVDNGAMIAYAGEILFGAGIKTPYNKIEDLDIKPRQRTDDVEVNWK